MKLRRNGISSLIFLSTLSIGHAANTPPSSQTSNAQIMQLNTQIQNQLKQLQIQNQQQITTLNNQVQQQFKQIHTDFQTQIQRLNTQTQNQIRQIQNNFQQQMQQLQKQINQIGKTGT